MGRMRHLGVLIAAAVCVAGVGACASGAPPRSTASVTAPANDGQPLGKLVHLPDGRVSATGVVARYPVDELGGVGYIWGLYASLGTSVTPPAVLAALSAAPGAPKLERYDGRLVTVRGTLSQAGKLLTPSLDSQIIAHTVLSAAPEAQKRIVWREALVQPGEWYKDEARLRLALAFERTSKGAYHSIQDAARAAGRPIQAPTDPSVGRLVGIVVTTTTAGAPPEYTLVYSSGLDVGSSPGRWKDIYRRVKKRTKSGKMVEDVTVIKTVLSTVPPDYRADVKRSGLGSAGSGPPQARLVDINGHNGVLGNQYSVRAGAVPGYVEFWDGHFEHLIGYWGTLGKGPTAKQLLAIARSIPTG